MATFIILIIAAALFTKKTLSYKKEIKELQSFKHIKEIIEVASQDKNIMKSMIKINTVLLKELNMDFSSFFVVKNGDLKLIESNVSDIHLRKRLKTIKGYRSYEGNDFREAFQDDQKIVPIKSKEPLQYIENEFRSIRNAMVIPLFSNGSLMAYWLIEDARPGYIDGQDMNELIVLANILSINLVNGLNLYLDPLLKIPKRDFFFEWLDVQRSKKINFAVGFLDIDHFKNVNDTYGHHVGDEVLIIISDIISDSIRDDDIVARYGGEEILIGLGAIEKEDALIRMNEIRKRIESTKLAIENKTELSITASIGVAFNDESGDDNQLIQIADRRVYIAKENGRNQMIARG